MDALMLRTLSAILEAGTDAPPTVAVFAVYPDGGRITLQNAWRGDRRERAREILAAAQALVASEAESTEEELRRDAAIAWRPAVTAPRDGRPVLARNNRGNYAVVLWSDDAYSHESMPPFNVPMGGWVPLFADGRANPFWNGANGSIMTHWAEITPPGDC